MYPAISRAFRPAPTDSPPPRPGDHRQVVDVEHPLRAEGRERDETHGQTDGAAGGEGQQHLSHGVRAQTRHDRAKDRLRERLPTSHGILCVGSQNLEKRSLVARSVQIRANDLEHESKFRRLDPAYAAAALRAVSALHWPAPLAEMNKNTKQ